MLSARARRVLQEAVLLARHFGVVDYDDEDGSWLHIAHFGLPVGWDRPSTALLIELPPAYPHVPPDGFYLDRLLRTALGQSVDHYFENPGAYNRHADRGWAWFCIHLNRGTWRPRADVAGGDNLLKLTVLIRAILSEMVQ
jgi:hypothetical protein